MLNKRRLFALGAVALLFVAVFAAFAFVSQPVSSALAQDDPSNISSWFAWAARQGQPVQIFIDFNSSDINQPQLSMPSVSRRLVFPPGNIRFIGSDYVCFAYGDTEFSNLGCVPYSNINEFGTYVP